SSPPNASTVSPIIFWTWSGLDTSAWRLIAPPPIFSAAAWAVAASRSAHATFAPRSANSSAIAKPRPRPAPVTRVRLPSSSMSRSCDLRVLGEAEVLQRRHQLVVAERLAGAGEADARRAAGADSGRRARAAAAHEAVREVGLEQPGLLV